MACRNNTIKVACKPFGTMLRGAGLASGVDIASIDVEGAELQVLATMDWSIPVRVWMIELDGTNKTKDAAVRALLWANGYCRAPSDLLHQYCGKGTPAQPRPTRWCTQNEVFEQCNQSIFRVSSRQ